MRSSRDGGVKHSPGEVRFHQEPRPSRIPWPAVIVIAGVVLILGSFLGVTILLALSPGGVRP